MSGHGHGHGHSHFHGIVDDHKEHRERAQAGHVDHGHAGHDHSKDDAPSGEIYSLYRYIDTTRLLCLNESTKDSVKTVFKPYDKKHDKTQFVLSDADPELIIKIPFTGVVKLKSINIIGGPEGESPSKVKLFINRDDVDFSNAAEMKAVQQIEMAENLRGEIDWPVQVYNFNNVSSLTMYFPENHGAENTRIYYIGLKGEFTQLKREAVVANYELRPQASKNDNPTQVKFNSTVQ